MAGLHLIGSIVTLVAAGMLVVGGGMAALADRGHAAVGPLAVLAMGVFVAQSLLGVPVLLAAGGPSEVLHLLYGLALIVLIPLARAFVADAPDRARSGVLAVAGLVALALAWRLFATG